ncbi:MAG: tyrosine--tRNA ligase, partial [Planctomycetota bacterium]|nr:tyrosine--tRNA ligase [Planctomycetota bacterium]
MIDHDELRTHLAPIARTVEAILPERELLEKLQSGRPLRCKFGIDPTSPTVHVGNGIPLWNLRKLQDMGHTAVLILGDYTATVGDPSGKDKTRPMLTPEDVEAHLATWMDQMALILDMDKVEIRRNSEWFKDMTFLEVLDLTNRMTVQQMMERDAFEKRWKKQEPISVREFLYCLMQGWDSVMVEADVELGGTDQTFNLSVGRRLMEQKGLPPQVSLISPLVEGTDGHAKMSKSLGNAI